MGGTKASHPDELVQVVRIALVHGLLVREVVTLDSACDARFEATFHSVPCEVVGRLELAGSQQGARIANPEA